MSRERQLAVARKGGASVPAYARAFNDRELAISAGRKGGLAKAANRAARLAELARKSLPN